MKSDNKSKSFLQRLKNRLQRTAGTKEYETIKNDYCNFIRAVENQDESIVKDPASAFRMTQLIKSKNKEFDLGLLLDVCQKSAEILNANKKSISNDVLLENCKNIAVFLHKNRKRFTDDGLKAARKQIRDTISSVEKKKGYRAYLKSHYIKGVYPKAYYKRSNDPVSNTVLIVSKYIAPTPTAIPVGKALEAQGKYNVKYVPLRLRRVPDIEFYENGLRFVKQMASAHAVILTESNELLSHFDVREETKIIQLWHGVGMFKKCGYSLIPEEERGNVEYNSYRNYTDVTIAAPIQRESFEESMNIPKGSDVIKPIGIARTDVFYDPAYYEQAYKKLYEAFPDLQGKKLILYAPTYRGPSNDGRGPDQLDMQMMYEALGDKYALLIKHHGLAKVVPPIPKELDDVFAYDMAHNRVLTIEELLAVADICITDYSSVGFEYAITERPLLFYAYDIEDYIDERGLYFGYDEITPGPIVKTTEEIVDYIRNIEQRFDPTVVKAFKEKYVCACDGHALERTLALLD